MRETASKSGELAQFEPQQTMAAERERGNTQQAIDEREAKRKRE
jgi:hypothetical protein